MKPLYVEKLACEMEKHDCSDPSQCWEPCGDLGNDPEYAVVDEELNQILSERRIERVRRVINSWPRWKRDFKLVSGPEQIRTTSMKERISKLRKDPKKSKALDKAAEKIFKELEMIEREEVVSEERSSGQYRTLRSTLGFPSGGKGGIGRFHVSQKTDPGEATYLYDKHLDAAIDGATEKQT